MLKISVSVTSHYDVKYRKKTITSVMKVSTYTITSIKVRPIGLTVILEIMHVSTFKTAIILLIISHVLECEMRESYPRVHIFKSERRLVEFLMKENLKPNMELFHLTLLIIFILYII